MTGLVLCLLAVLGASAVQSATGFGFALLAVPVLTAVFGPLEAVSTVALLGLAVNGLTLTSERRPLAVLRPTAAGLIAWSLPGMAAGALLAAYAPADTLRLVVAAAVLAAVGGYAWAGGAAARARSASPSTTARAAPAARRARAPRTSAPGSDTARAGLLAGALSTSTGLNGPPLVLHLLRRRAGPAHQRDTLAVVFLATGVLTLAALACVGALRVPAGALVLLLGAVAGQLLGRLAFARIGGRHEGVSLAVLAVSGMAALVPAGQALL